MAWICNHSPAACDRALSHGAASCSSAAGMQCRSGLFVANTSSSQRRNQSCCKGVDRCSLRFGAQKGMQMRTSMIAYALLPMPSLNPLKLTVTYLASASANVAGPLHELAGRRYTVTHNDLTGHLYVSVGEDFNQQQYGGWYTRLVRDEVRAEWCFHGASPALHLHCHVSGAQLPFVPPRYRNFIFKREMPLVLDSIVYAEKYLFRRPALRSAPLFVHFESCEAELSRVEYWGTLGEWIERDGLQPAEAHLARVSRTLPGAQPAIPGPAQLEGPLELFLEYLTNLLVAEPPSLPLPELSDSDVDALDALETMSTDSTDDDSDGSGRGDSDALPPPLPAPPPHASTPVASRSRETAEAMSMCRFSDAGVALSSATPHGAACHEADADARDAHVCSSIPMGSPALYAPHHQQLPRSFLVFGLGIQPHVSHTSSARDDRLEPEANILLRHRAIQAHAMPACATSWDSVACLAPSGTRATASVRRRHCHERPHQRPFFYNSAPGPAGDGGRGTPAINRAFRCAQACSPHGAVTHPCSARPRLPLGRPIAPMLHLPGVVQRTQDQLMRGRLSGVIALAWLALAAWRLEPVSGVTECDCVTALAAQFGGYVVLAPHAAVVVKFALLCSTCLTGGPFGQAGSCSELLTRESQSCARVNSSRCCGYMAGSSSC